MAHEYHATIAWQFEGDNFSKGRYSRAHEWKLDGLTLPASPGAGVVPLPFIRADAIDPEEALVAAVSSCHMLTFLDLARHAGLVIESYTDEAVGELNEIAPHRKAVTKITLRPKIVYAGDPPDKAKLDELHHKAHEYCFIANSVKSEIVIEAQQ